jgi:uncharacterized protein (UPF0305 family)
MYYSEHDLIKDTDKNEPQKNQFKKKPDVNVKLFFIICAIILVIIIPIAAYQKHPEQFTLSGRFLPDKTDTIHFTIGVTTKDEILFSLGHPTYVNIYTRNH